jgi:hypothetical protein
VLTAVTVGDKVGGGDWRVRISCCTSLERIATPPALKVIKKRAFRNSTGMTTVTLGEGTEEIGETAFYGCTLLQRIDIPTIVKAIKKRLCTIAQN